MSGPGRGGGRGSSLPPGTLQTYIRRANAIQRLTVALLYVLYRHLGGKGCQVSEGGGERGGKGVTVCGLPTDEGKTKKRLKKDTMVNESEGLLTISKVQETGYLTEEC